MMGHDGTVGHASESLPICRNVTIAGRRTSVRLEVVFWEGLIEICAREQIGINDVCTRIDAVRKGNGLAALLRVFVLCYFRELARRPIPVPLQISAEFGIAPTFVAAVLEGATAPV